MAHGKLHSVLRKYWWEILIVVLSVSGVLFSAINFPKEQAHDWLYDTFRLFLLNVQFNVNAQLSLGFKLGRWLIFIVFILLSFRILTQILAPKWWHNFIKRYFPCSKRYLLAGTGEQAKILAKNLTDNHCRCIFLVPKEKENDKALFDELGDMGAVVLYANFEDDKVMFPKQIAKYFFVEEDENFNMKIAVRLLEQLKSETPSKEVNIYVRTESGQFYSSIENELKANEESCKNIEFHIFNQSDLTARLFIKENPMLNCPNVTINTEKMLVKGKFNVLLLGFGWQGQELLKKCVCDSQFAGSTFQATIIDNGFETRYGDYPVLYDECIEHYNLQFKMETVGSIAFYKWLNVQIGNFNRIIIALGSDSVNMDAAEKIAKILHKQGTFDTQKIVFAHLQQLKSYSSDFTPFGKLTDIYTKEIIVNEADDEIAKMVNYVYNHSEIKIFNEFTENDKAKIQEEWKSTTLFNKDSSRAVAQNIGNMMKIADKNVLELNDTELDIIAENEHLRWNAFHFVNGIRKWNLDEINTSNAKFRHNGNLLKHGCLVSFSKLDKVSAKVRQLGNVHENYAETDRRIVRHFLLFLKEVEELKNAEK